MIPLNSHPQNHDDTRLDRVLHSLATPPIPTHLQHRVLLAVEHRTATPKTRLSPRTWLLALAIPAAAAVLLAVLLHPHPPAPLTRGARGLRGRSVLLQTHPPAPLTPQNPRPLDRSEAQWRDPRLSPSTPLPANPPPQQLASYPAPEAPLTDQEKLLLRVAQGAHHNFDPLTPDALEREIAENKAEFDHFFPPPPPPELAPLTPPTTQENPNEVHPLSR